MPCIIADVIGDSSLISPYFFVYFLISDKVEWFSLIKTISSWLAVWLSGNALASINVVALRQTQLVPG